MRFELMSVWPGPGGYVLDGGTVIDATEPKWRGVPMPLNAKALDTDAANAMVRWHSHNQHLLHFAPGIKPTVKINH